MTYSNHILETKIHSLGFDVFGVVRSKPVSSKVKGIYSKWLNSGYNAQMDYMSNNIEKRFNPQQLVDYKVNTLIVLGVSYYNALNQSIVNKSVVKISEYALGKNYHNVITKKLKKLSNLLKDETGCNFRYFIDTAPIMEKYWANEAGLGNIGKNGSLIVPDFGSKLFLAVCLTDLEFDEYNNCFEDDLCGECSLCIDVCPTNAIMDNGLIDCNKCISYLTIEKKDNFDSKTPKWENWIWGCDVCQNICPHNNGLKETREKSFCVLPEIKDIMEGKVDFELFDSTYSGTSLKRGGDFRLRRNLKKVRFKKRVK